jgi:hypothetical protein
MRCTNVSCASKGTSLRGKSAVTAGAISLAVMGCLTHAAWAVTRTETFDSSAGNFTTQVRNGVDGNNLAFSNTDNTGTGGGTSGAGEFGGVFARTSEATPAYVADANLGGSLIRTDVLSLSGRFIVTANDGMDGSICVGYINTSSDSPFGSSGDAGFTGFAILEPNPGPALRAQLFAKGNNITGSQSGIDLNTEYSFNLTYDPNTFVLGGTIGPLTFPPAQTGLDPGDTFNAFAMLSGTAGSSNAGQTATAYFDDLTYTIVPEPASALLMVGAAAMLRRRQR